MINDNFYKIKIGSNVGFIHQTGIKTLIYKSPTSNTGIGQYGSTRVRTFFYESPDVSSKPIKTLAPNSSFEYINMTLINDNFYKIKIGSKVGFIHQTGIKK